MYFPYLRGRQYELLALRELANNNLLGDYVIPIIEPVKLSPTLVNTMADFIKTNHPLSVIRNPAVGTFMSDWQDVQEETKEAGYKQRFADQYENPIIIKSSISISPLPLASITFTMESFDFVIAVCAFLMMLSFVFSISA